MRPGHPFGDKDYADYNETFISRGPALRKPRKSMNSFIPKAVFADTGSTSRPSILREVAAPNTEASEMGKLLLSRAGNAALARAAVVEVILILQGLP